MPKRNHSTNSAWSKNGQNPGSYKCIVSLPTKNNNI